MTAPATYEQSGRNRVPEDTRTMYQLRAEQHLRMLTGIDAEEALNRGLDFEYNNAIYAVMDALYLDDQSAGKTSPPPAQARQCMTLPARGWWIPACSIGGVTDVWADGHPLSQDL